MLVDNAIANKVQKPALADCSNTATRESWPRASVEFAAVEPSAEVVELAALELVAVEFVAAELAEAEFVAVEMTAVEPASSVELATLARWATPVA